MTSSLVAFRLCRRRRYRSIFLLEQHVLSGVRLSAALFFPRTRLTKYASRRRASRLHGMSCHNCSLSRSECRCKASPQPCVPSIRWLRLNGWRPAVLCVRRSLDCFPPPFISPSGGDACASVRLLIHQSGQLAHPPPASGGDCQISRWRSCRLARALLTSPPLAARFARRPPIFGHHPAVLRHSDMCRLALETGRRGHPATAPCDAGERLPSL